MVAVNKCFAPLVYRYCGYRPVPTLQSNVWDTVPFNNQTFCELTGIQFTPNKAPVGLDEIPEQLEGAEHYWTPKLRQEYHSRINGAKQFLRYLDSQYVSDFVNKTAKLEDFQNTYRGAPGKQDWEWIWSRVFEQPGGLRDHLRICMKDMGCDAATAYRKHRKQAKAKKQLNGELFREYEVPKSLAFDVVWADARHKMAPAVFGSAVLDDDGDRDSNYDNLTRALCYRIFEKDRKAVGRRIGGLKVAEEGLEAAYNDALKHPTIQSLRLLVNYHENIVLAQQITGINVEKDRGSWTERIENLYKDLGVELKDGKVKRIPPITTKANMVPWDELRETVESFIANLQGRMAISTSDDIDGDDHEPHSGEPQIFDPSLIFTSDAGVSQFAKHTIKELLADLGLTNMMLPGRPKGTKEDPAPEPSWHQWVAVSAMLTRAFTEEIGDEGNPTLLADQVGMGKTIEVILFIEVLWKLIGLQQANANWPEIGPNEGGLRWPKLLGKRKYFMGQKTIPRLPIVLVMQKGLIAQWREELARWVDPAEAHVMEYFGNDASREAFFAEKSLFSTARSQAAAERTIVLAHAPSVVAEMRTRMVKRAPNFARGDPCEAPTQLLERSIFGQEWLLGIVEEAHNYRVNGNGQRAMITLMCQCAYRIAVTATPVFTQARDLLSLCRILRARCFIGDLGANLTKIVNQSIRAEEKIWDQDPEHADLCKFLHDYSNKSTPADENVSSTSRASSPQLEEFIMTSLGDTKSFRAFWTSRHALKLLRTSSEGILIRRDERSVDPHGNKLIKHAKEIRISSWIAMDANTNAAVQGMTATKDRRKEGRANMDGFFTLMKQLLVHWMINDYKTGTDTHGQPYSAMSTDQFAHHIFPDYETYRTRLSPKLDRGIRLVKHHLGDKNSNAVPLEHNKDGNEIPSTIILRPGEHGQRASRRRKIVIYCHMRSSWSIVARALELEDIDSVRINGTMDPAEREQAIKKFQSEDSPDVIIISDVAAAGLNLQRGSIVIFVDHPWSASEKQQIIGRVLRHGQDRQVIVYDLMIPNTSDEFLQGFADGKGLMYGVYTRSLDVRGQKVESESEPEDEDPVIQLPARVGKSKRTTAGTKAALTSNKKSSSSNQKGQGTVIEHLGQSNSEVAGGDRPDGSVIAPDVSEASLNTLPSDIIFNQVHPAAPQAGPKPRANHKAKLERWNKAVNYTIGELKSTRRHQEDQAKKDCLAQTAGTSQNPPSLVKPRPRMRPLPQSVAGLLGAATESMEASAALADQQAAATGTPRSSRAIILPPSPETSESIPRWQAQVASAHAHSPVSTHLANSSLPDSTPFPLPHQSHPPIPSHSPVSHPIDPTKSCPTEQVHVPDVNNSMDIDQGAQPEQSTDMLSQDLGTVSLSGEPGSSSCAGVKRARSPLSPPHVLSSPLSAPLSSPPKRFEGAAPQAGGNTDMTSQVLSMIQQSKKQVQKKKKAKN